MQKSERYGSSLVLRLLSRRIGIVSPEIEAKIRTLSIAQVEELGEALLNFSQPSDLDEWLRLHG
ncbi:MAG: DUF4351 domain-containing protein [Acaryochloridaceae cyanobacterium RU_4_10]|nr:DUF4351 domain-containing protein [Acaryochloridaceae cyanobacterium RU_4_10]